MLTFFRSIYKRFFSPLQKNEALRNRELVLNVLLAGSIAIVFLSLILVVGNYVSGNHRVLPRIPVMMLAFLLVCAIYALSRKGYYKLSAWLLVSVYFALAAFVGLMWSISLPSAGLLYGLVVVLGGILLGPRYSLVVFVGVVLLIAITTILGSTGSVTHDLIWAESVPNIDDAVGLSFMLCIIAMVSWLFNNQMARSLVRAEKAEAALTKQKELLEVKVDERTRELQAAQLERVQQMYRFAELGQISTAMMHDLANHLTSLTMNIESLEGEKRSRVLSDAKRSIRHIDTMIARVRDQLNGRAQTGTFSVVPEITAILKMLRPRAQRDDVDILFEANDDPANLRVHGDSIRFRQMIANLICNAADAYEGIGDRQQKIVITAETRDRYIIITVNDWGAGIPVNERKHLFEPFRSTKADGMGMGLFVVKQIATEHFLGKVDLDSEKKHTSFVVRLPRVG